MGERGYSLLEVMISLVVLAIAFLALVATQLTTLNGYVSAHDALESAELGRRTAELLRVQGSQWILNLDANPDPMIEDLTFIPNPPFLTTDPMPFDVENPIADILDGTGDWVALVDTPVDTRFNRNAASVSEDVLGGKYCIYARGGVMNQTFENFGGVPVMSGMKFQIAVVYPGPRATLTSCVLDDLVTDALLSDVGDRTAADPSPGMEQIGLRGSYTGTIIVRRAHLTNYAASGGP